MTTEPRPHRMDEYGEFCTVCGAPAFAVRDGIASASCVPTAADARETSPPSPPSPPFDGPRDSGTYAAADGTTKAVIDGRAVPSLNHGGPGICRLCYPVGAPAPLEPHQQGELLL